MRSHIYRPTTAERVEKRHWEKQSRAAAAKREPPYRIYTLTITTLKPRDVIHRFYVSFREPREVEKEATRLTEHWPNSKVYSGWLKYAPINHGMLVELGDALTVAEVLRVAEKLWGE